MPMKKWVQGPSGRDRPVVPRARWRGRRRAGRPHPRRLARRRRDAGVPGPHEPGAPAGARRGAGAARPFPGRSGGDPARGPADRRTPGRSRCARTRPCHSSSGSGAWSRRRRGSTWIRRPKTPMRRSLGASWPRRSSAWAAPFRDLDTFAAAVRERRALLASLRTDNANLGLATAHATKGLEFDHVGRPRDGGRPLPERPLDRRRRGSGPGARGRAPPRLCRVDPRPPDADPQLRPGRRLAVPPRGLRSSTSCPRRQPDQSARIR